MAYTGTDPDLVDLQHQITTNLNTANAAIASIQTQIKQVTLTLEGELAKTVTAFNTLEAYVQSKIPS